MEQYRREIGQLLIYQTIDRDLNASVNLATYDVIESQ